MSADPKSTTEDQSLLKNAQAAPIDVHQPLAGTVGPEPSPGVFSQLGASVIRCTALKMRKPVSCAVEIVLPILFIVLLAWLSTLVKSKDHPGRLMVDPINYGVRNVRDQIREAACVNVTSTPATYTPEFVLDSILPRCPGNTVVECNLEHLNKVSTQLCRTGRGMGELANYLQDLKYVSAIPTFDEMVVTHALFTQWWGPMDGDFPVPELNNVVRQQGKVYVAGDDAAVQALTAALNTSADSNGFGFFTRGWYGGKFPTQQDAFSYLTSLDGASKAVALLTVDQFQSPDRIAVTISMNKSAVPWTTATRSRFAQGDGGTFRQYYGSGFMSLQRAIFESFLDASTITVNDEFAQAGGVAGMIPMPYIDYKQQIFLQLAGVMVPLALSLSFLAGVSQVAERLVQEKELRLREAMAAMGVGKVTLFVAWLCTFGLINLLTGTGCTVALHITFISKTTMSLLWVLFVGFALSTTALGCLLSSLFSKSRTAAIATPIIFFACAIPSFALNPASFPGIIKLLMVFLSPTAFAAGLRTVIEYEQNNGIGWNDLYNSNDEIPLGLSLFYLYFSFIWYSLLTLYLDTVLAGEWGVSKHPCFCILDCFRKRRGDDGPASEELSANGGPNTKSGASEGYPTGSAEAVNISNVTKEFGSGDDVKTAVSGMSLRIYPAMVTAVLGHNGAGKTTLFNMLTGMLPITRGDCHIFGHSITDASTDARRNIGMCPQHNILWDDLTCREHLVYFAMVKGLPIMQCGKAADEMLERVDLASKRNARSASLSGGQKRKLSVAIAFIGGSKLVLLDEPTAGMDVHTRRHTWELIQRMAREEGRAIILTTHFMDEAELLGDRVAIMAAGQLHSYGSTTYLKSTLGQAYTLNVQYEHPPDADTRKEVLGLVKAEIRHAKEKEARGREQAITLPMEDVAKFADMLRVLEREQSRLGLSSFSMSAATIEDVFVAIAHAGDDVENVKDSFSASNAHLIAERQDSGTTAAASQAALTVNESGEDIGADLMASGASDGSVSPVIQFAGLMKKRFHNAKRDKRALVLQIVLPIICIVLAMALAKLGPPETPSALIDPHVLPDQQIATEGGCGGDFERAMGRFMTTEKAAPGATAYETATFLQSTYNDHGSADRTVAIQCMDRTQQLPPSMGSNTSVSVLFSNSTAYFHSAPYSQILWYTSRVSASRARAANTNGATASPTPKTDAQIWTYPFPFTIREKQLVDQNSNAIMALFIVIPFSFIPSTFTAFVVKERASKAKLLQFVSGVGYGSYWASNFLFDMVSFLITTVLAFIIFAIFGHSEYIGADAFGATLLLFLLYGLAAIPTSYVMALPFNNHSTAQNAVLGVFFLAGFGLTLAGFLIVVLKGPVAIRFLFRIFPPASLGEGLMALANAPGKAQISGKKVDLLAMDEAGWAMLYLGVVAVVCTVIILFVDHPERAKRQQMLSYKSHQTAPTMADESQDVAKEREAVKNATGDDAFLKVSGLRKEYPAPAGSDSSKNVAVQNLAFRVPKGEIFGLLGTNGAGKTTTMNVITGECLPTMGEATVAGFDVVSQAGLARQLIGYCPQFDALHDLMTVDEHLELYCALRGVSNVERVSVSLCTALGLAEYRRVLSKSLSGGNKRKLSVAIAMIGAPRLLLLDEPTAGMDPVARRSMCDVVSAVSRHCAVVLTTHHLEEVEALADRAAIMVAGRMQCLGTLEHLKATLGEGYQVSLRLDSEDKAKAVADKLDAAYPGACKLTEQHQTRLRFTVKNKGDMTLSALFALLHDLKTGRDSADLGVLDYTVSQSSVEEVFLAVAGGHSDVLTGPADEASAGQMSHPSAMDE